MRRRLPIRIADPCQEDWSAMSARGDGRHCTRCATTVVDLSRVTRAQAEAIVRARGGRVCGRVRSDANGDAVFAAEPVRRGLVPVALAGLLAACTTESGPETETEVQAVVAPPTDVGGASIDARPDPITGGGVGSFGGSIATGTMMPIGPATPPVPVPDATASSVPCSPDDDVIPTAEQRALTRRKHQRHVASYPPPPHHTMGIMVMDDF